ncbi:MAG: RusA family crossover junction endodeoxyribonuclease [Verrucomicrobiota bacterium]
MPTVSTIAFKIPGPPKGKGRPRATRTGRMYTPKSTASYENLVKLCYQQDSNGKRFEDAVTVNILVYYEIPKSYSKKKREEAMKGKLMPTKTPDCDNVIKIILDALNGIAYSDDRQVTKVTLEKMYTDKAPSTLVWMTGKIEETERNVA